MTNAEHLALLTRKLFHSGFNKALVDRKWPAFEEVFHRFDPVRVAEMDALEVAQVLEDARIVRHGRKVRATVHNAAFFTEMMGIHGSWASWREQERRRPYAERARTLQKALMHCGPNTVFYYLLEAGEATLADRPKDVR